MRYEYIVVPAPTRGDKTKGAKTPADRYATAIAGELNRLAAEGWDYVRAEVLPSEERAGLTGRTTVYHNLLVFRRPMAALESVAAPAKSARPQPEYPVEDAPPRMPKPVPESPPASPRRSEKPAATSGDQPPAQDAVTPPAPHAPPREPS